jgi:hypothetical protein
MHITDLLKEIKKDLNESILGITDHVSYWHVPPANATLLNMCLQVCKPTKLHLQLLYALYFNYVLLDAIMYTCR